MAECNWCWCKDGIDDDEGGDEEEDEEFFKNVSHRGDDWCSPKNNAILHFYYLFFCNLISRNLLSKCFSYVVWHFDVLVNILFLSNLVYSGYGSLWSLLVTLYFVNWWIILNGELILLGEISFILCYLYMLKAFTGWNF